MSTVCWHRWQAEDDLWKWMQVITEIIVCGAGWDNERKSD